MPCIRKAIDLQNIRERKKEKQKKAKFAGDCAAARQIPKAK